MKNQDLIYRKFKGSINFFPKPWNKIIYIILYNFIGSRMFSIWIESYSDII